MINSKIFKLNAVILLVSFLGSFQMGLAQTTQVETPITAANSSDITKAADTKINHVTYGLPPKLTSAEIEALDKKNRAKGIIERIRYRDIKSIKWPADSLENSNDGKEKFNNITEKKNALDKKCRLFAAQYSNEAKKNLGIRKGILNLDSICDISVSSLKNIKDIDDEAFNEFGAAIVERFDRILYVYYNSNAFKMNKFYDKSFFGLVGIPAHFGSIFIQSLAFLSLILNFFLLYKFFRS